MSRLFPAALAFAALVASPLAAQQARFQTATAPVSTASAEAPAVHRIMTLAWTDIRLPQSLATSPTSAPTPSARPQIFTLTWQDADGRDTTPAIAVASPQPCTVTVLITVPCSVQ